MATQVNTIGTRVIRLVEAVIEKSTIPKQFHGVILSLARNNFANLPDDKIREALTELQTQVIPWILTGNDENKDSQ